MPDKYKDLPTDVSVNVRLINGELISCLIEKYDDLGLYVTGHSDGITFIPWTAVVQINY